MNNQQLTSKNLLIILSVLKEGRLYYCDQLSTNSRLKRDIIKYRKQPAVMNILVSKIHLDFLLNHFEIVNNFVEVDDVVRVKIGNLLFNTIKETINLNSTNLPEEILKTQRKIISKLLESEDDMQKKFEELLLDKERGNAQYEDYIEKLENELKRRDYC